MSAEVIRGIADGGDFDLVEAIRAIARYLSPAEVDAVVHQAEQVALDLGGVADAVVPVIDDSLTLAGMIGDKFAGILSAAGFDSADKIKAALDSELLSIKGIGDTALAAIRKAIG